MGRLLGWQLTRLGHSVTVYEQASRSAPQSAAHVAAAMLAPMSELPDGSVVLATAGDVDLLATLLPLGSRSKQVFNHDVSDASQVLHHIAHFEVLMLHLRHEPLQGFEVLEQGRFLELVERAR